VAGYPPRRFLPNRIHLHAAGRRTALYTLKTLGRLRYSPRCSGQQDALFRLVRQGKGDNAPWLPRRASTRNHESVHHVSRTRCGAKCRTADAGPRFLPRAPKESGVPGLHPPSLKLRRASEQARHSLGDGGQRTTPHVAFTRCAALNSLPQVGYIRLAVCCAAPGTRESVFKESGY
jgi:hypothetical protein